MNRWMKFVGRTLLLAAFAGLGMCSRASAQAGSCKDPWINSAYNQLYSAPPVGSGASADCNPSLYGGGHWTTLPDLMAKVKATHCNDPWIVSAYLQLYRAEPSGLGTAGDCNPALYGSGHWSTLADLKTKVIAAKTTVLPSTIETRTMAPPASSIVARGGAGVNPVATVPGTAAPNTMAAAAAAVEHRVPRGRYTVDRAGNLLNSSGNVVLASGSYVFDHFGGAVLKSSGPPPGGAIVPAYGMVWDAN